MTILNMNGMAINSLRRAEPTPLIAESEKGLQVILNKEQI